ncbi:cell division protein FtsA [Patescibacteria group bacterium]
MRKANIIAGLDVGSSEIKILVAQKKPQKPELEVLAQASEVSSGVRRGVVANPEEVSKKIYSVLSQVQNKISQKIDSVVVNIGGSHIFSNSSHGVVAVSRADQKISQEDIERVMQAAQAFSLPSNKEIISVFPKEFIVDGQGQIKDPLGMAGVRLEVEILAICAFSPYLKSLSEAVLDAGLQIDDIILTPLASAKSVLTPKQKELGVGILDIGAGTTSLAVFEEGDLIHTAIFPIGSDHITNDIAIGLKSDLDIAERIKLEFGSCLPTKAAKQIKIERTEEPLIFPQKMLVKIIEARASEIFDQVQKELKKISRDKLLPAGIILTGGGAKLPKMVDLSKRELKLPCHIGTPQGFIGIEEDPCLSTVCGLILEKVDFEEEGESSNFSKDTIQRLKKMFKIFIP